MFNRGGQKRTIELACGFRIVGHPREVDGKHKIHKKRCSTCSEEDIKIPKFNQESGELNGSNGFRGEKKLTKMRASTIVNGVQTDIMTDATTVEKAISSVKAISSAKLT